MVQKRFNEYFAKVVLEKCFPEKFIDLQIADKPDLRSSSEIGIEVTHCMPKKAVEAFNLWQRVAEQGEQTPPRILERLEQLKDTVHLEGDELIWEYGSYVEDDIDNSPIKDFVNAVANKVLNFVVGKDIYYHYDNEQNRLICDNSNWNGGNGTIEQDMEPIEYTLEYDELPNLYNPNPGTFKADEYISFESVINTETGKKYVWEYMNSYSIDLSQNYEKNTIHIHGEWQDIVTNIRYKNEGGSRLRGNFPTSIKYFDKIEIGSLHKAGYVFNGWSINGNKLASSILR